MSRVLYYVVIKPLSYLPLSVLYPISNFLYFVVYQIFGYRKKVVYQNIKNSFPTKTEAELIKIQSDSDEDKEKEDEIAHALVKQGVDHPKAHNYAREQLIREKVWEMLGVKNESVVS